MSYGEIEALTHEALAQQIERVVEAYPEALLVGSLGRAAVYDSVLGNPMHEYELRDQALPGSTNRRTIDIDLIGLSNGFTYEPNDESIIDAYAFNNRIVSIKCCDGEWILRSAWCGFERVIHPKAMNPTAGRTIGGVECKTPPPETQLALLKIWGADRRKDKQAQKVLAGIVGNGSQEEVGPDLLAPFYELAEINRCSMSSRLKRIYHRMPEPLTDRISSAILPAKRSLEARFS